MVTQGQLLISGVVKLVRTENGDSFYDYILEGRERRLAEVTERRGCREAVLSEAVSALMDDKEPMKRELYAKLNAQAQAAYKRMDSDLESAEEKKRKLGSLRKGVAERHAQLKEDILDGLQDGEEIRGMLVFYENMVSLLDREQRRVDTLIKEWVSIANQDEDEF